MKDPALKQHYLKEVVKKLFEMMGYKNLHQVPAVLKVVINSGIKATEEKQWIEKVAGEITQLAGQLAVITVAKESISNFKLRKGMPIGVKVTLRGNRMYEFLDRLINIALPTGRDFRGVSANFDGNGNYTLGIQDHTIFPEINLGGSKVLGLDITIVTSASTDTEGRELLKLLGVPFRLASTQAQAK